MRHIECLGWRFYMSDKESIVCKAHHYFIWNSVCCPVWIFSSWIFISAGLFLYYTNLGCKFTWCVQLLFICACDFCAGIFYYCDQSQSTSKQGCHSWCLCLLLCDLCDRSQQSHDTGPIINNKTHICPTKMSDLWEQKVYPGLKGGYRGART